jgi:hypothetical protein
MKMLYTEKSGKIPLKMELFTLEFRVFWLFFWWFFWWFYFMKFECVSGVSEIMRGVWWYKCECVFHTCSRIRARGTSGTRPPTSCRAFLLRTLPPPPHPWIPNVTNMRSRKHQDLILITYRYYVCVRVEVPVRVVTCSTWSGGRPPTPLPPLPPQRPKSSKK